MTLKKYPGKRYHVDGRTCYVQSKDEDQALGAGWSDSPDAAEAKAEKDAKKDAKEK